MHTNKYFLTKNYAGTTERTATKMSLFIDFIVSIIADLIDK